MMRIGFAKSNITPPVGTELGGYAGYRPCAGIHDPLYCKAVLLEQDGARYALLAFDLLCVDEALYLRLAEALQPLGISRQRLIACAIHSHASPVGVIPGEGPLAAVNQAIEPKDPGFKDYMESVIQAAVSACRQAEAQLEAFRLRVAQGPIPKVGSERHTGGALQGSMTVVQFRTENGRLLTVYNFPCHPTVLSAANLQVSADFVAGIEDLLRGDMAVFLNGAAGDISTRFTRAESSFGECDRMARIAAEQIHCVLSAAEFREPEPIRGIHASVTLQARQVGTPEEAEKRLEAYTARWKAAEAEGADARTLRILKSYVEGAGVDLEFSHTMAGIRQFRLPVTVFRFAGLDFATAPGELFSSLLPPGLSVISYANGYYRYISPMDAYDAGYYEAMGSILARGEGEKLINQIEALRLQLHMKDNKHGGAHFGNNS